MSDIWYYDLIIPPRHLLDPGELHVVDKLIKKVGFSMKNPYTGNITAFRVDKSTLEFTCHDFQDLVSLSHLTGIDRTNITIWKEDIDITIEFNLSPSLEAAYPINSKSGNFSASRLSIAIDNTFYRDIYREGLAHDIWMLYRNFCDYFHAYYGFSYNEGIIETVFEDLNLWKNICLDGNPRYLFWLNFFSNDRISRMNLDKMISLGGKRVNSKTGVFVFFSNTPWESTLPSLSNLNAAWLKFLSP